MKAKAHKLFGNKKPLDNQDSVDNNGLGGHNGDHVTTNDAGDLQKQQPQTFFNENLETTNGAVGQVHEDQQKVAHLDIAVEELDDEEVKFVSLVFLFIFKKHLFLDHFIFIFVDADSKVIGEVNLKSL